MRRVIRGQCAATCLLRRTGVVPVQRRALAGSEGRKEWRAVRLEKREDGIAYLTLANAKERNALSVATLEEIEAALRAVEEDRTLRAVVLRAEGPVFSAGHNVKEMVRGRTAPARDEGDYFRHCFGLCSRVMQTIRRLRAPVIAQVDGLATAAGAQLVASCDLVVASEESHFATPGVKIGLFCTTPAVALGRAINSEKKMMEMLLTGEPISAKEAHHYGLVNK